MSEYTSEYPDNVPVDAAIKQFFRDFYQTSDTPDAHDRYPEYFTDDATFKLASKVSKGKSEILATRKAMWEHIATRKHKPLKIFPFGPDATEMMLYGLVTYGMKNGKVNEVEWAGRARLVKQPDDAGYKFQYYQVYLDTTAITK